jgi:hypothetical protein
MAHGDDTLLCVRFDTVKPREYVFSSGYNGHRASRGGAAHATDSLSRSDAVVQWNYVQGVAVRSFAGHGGVRHCVAARRLCSLTARARAYVGGPLARRHAVHRHHRRTRVSDATANGPRRANHDGRPAPPCTAKRCGFSTVTPGSACHGSPSTSRMSSVLASWPAGISPRRTSGTTSRVRERVCGGTQTLCAAGCSASTASLRRIERPPSPTARSCDGVWGRPTELPLLARPAVLS